MMGMRGGGGRGGVNESESVLQAIRNVKLMTLGPLSVMQKRNKI